MTTLFLFAKQELVDKGLNDGELTFRQLAVTVTAYDAAGHAVADAEVLPHTVSGLCRYLHGTVGQPLVIGIT